MNQSINQTAFSFSRQTGTEFKSIQQANQMAANQTNKLPDFISVNSEFISIFSSSLSLWNYCYNNIQISFHFISETGFQKLKLMKLKSLILSFRLHYFPASQLLQQHFIHSRQFHFSIRFHYSFNLCFISIVYSFELQIFFLQLFIHFISHFEFFSFPFSHVGLGFFVLFLPSRWQ